MEGRRSRTYHVHPRAADHQRRADRRRPEAPLERRRNLSQLLEADQRYWHDVVRFRWLAVASYFGLAAGGFLPWSLPWSALASAVLLANTVAYTIYRRHDTRYSLYQDIASYLDVVTISLIIISAGTVTHPIWVAYVLVVPAIANFKQLPFNVVFIAFVLGNFAVDYVVADVWLAGGASLASFVVISVLLVLTGINFVMISANNVRLRDVIRLQATTDPLTGLANRRRLFEVLAARADEGTLLGVMMIDLDDFKALNDEQGHLAGDGVLARLGELLARVAPERSLASRYGGDEFVLVTELSSEAEAARLAEFVVREGRERLGATVSAGVALYPVEAATPEEALHLADCRLRAAKASGKGQARLGQAAA
jgi:diguanylate cyclase (GGDEF)-like protein